MKMYTFLRATLFFTLLLSLTACRDDTSPNEETNNLLEGTWEVSSFEVDGSEEMGSLFTSYRMIFTPETEEGGQTNWSYTAFNGDNVSTNFSYVVINDGTEVVIGEDQKFDLEISSTNLVLDGFVDGGSRWIFTAEKQ